MLTAGALLPAAIFLVRPGRGPWWPIVFSVVFWWLIALQVGFGFARQVGLHIPIGVAIMSLISGFTWWSCAYRGDRPRLREGSRMSLARRTVLQLAGGAGLAALVGCGRPADGPGTGELLTSALDLPPKFRTPLPIPPTARPARVAAKADHYVVTQRVADVRLLPDRTTRIWGFDGVFPGPTFRGRRGRPMVVTVRNELPVPTSTHLHGGVTPAESDGFPTDLITPAGYSPAPPHQHGMPGKLHDTSRDYSYPMTQRAATLWYHDHRMDFTGPQVWRGLAGMFIVTDEQEEALPLPRDERDIPLMICDRAFDADGSLLYPMRDMAMSAPGAKGDFVSGIFGDVILVNGAAWPRLEVAERRVTACAW